MRIVHLRSIPTLVCLIALSSCFALLGCDPNAIPDAGAAFLTNVAPSDPQTIAETVEDVTAESAVDEKHVIQGVIYAGESSPFQTGSAAFVMSELPDPEHGDGTIEHLDNCPFCKRKAEKATKAMVEFRGPDGKLLKTGADILLALRQGDQVIVQGSCQFDESLNLLIIDATSIHKVGG